jgi:heat shock protein HslJ
MYADVATTIREVPMKPILGLVPILLLAACSGGDEPADDPAAKAAADPLAETSWELLHIRKTAVPEDVTITARFTGGQVSGQSGCNRYVAAYALDGDRLSISPAGTTKMMCAKEVMAWEDEFLRFLESAHHYRFHDGGLQIFRDGQDALTFAPAPAEE